MKLSSFCSQSGHRQAVSRLQHSRAAWNQCFSLPLYQNNQNNQTSLGKPDLTQGFSSPLAVLSKQISDMERFSLSSNCSAARISRSPSSTTVSPLGTRVSFPRRSRAARKSGARGSSFRLFPPFYVRLTRGA